MDSLNLKALRPQVFSHQRAQLNIVVNDQNAVHDVHCSRSFSALTVKIRQTRQGQLLQRFTRIDALFTAKVVCPVFLFWVGYSKSSWDRRLAFPALLDNQEENSESQNHFNRFNWRGCIIADRRRGLRRG